MPVVRNNGGGHRITRSHGRIAVSGWQPETELWDREDGNEYVEVDMSRHLYLDAFQDNSPDAQDAAEHREHAVIQLHDHDEDQSQTMTPSSTSSYTLHPTSPPVYFRRTTGQSLTSMPSSVSVSSSSQHQHRHQLPTPPTSRTSSPSSGSPLLEGRGRPRGSGTGSKSSTERRARRNRERDPSWVPRPKNAFFQFRRAFVREHKERKEAARNGHAGAFVGDFTPGTVSLSKIAGDAWKLLAPEERERWKKMAEEEREEHARNHPDYRFRPVRRGPSAKQKARMLGSSFAFDDAAMIKDEDADAEHDIDIAIRRHTIPTMVLHGRGRSLDLDLSPPSAFLRLRQSTSSPCGSVSSSAPSRSSSSSPSFDYTSTSSPRSWCSSPDEAEIGVGDLHQLRLSSSSPSASASASVPIYYPTAGSHYSPTSTRPSTPYNERSELILPSHPHQSHHHHHHHHHAHSHSHSYPRVPSPLSLAPIQANPATPPPSEACDTLGQVQSNHHSQPQTGSAGHATYYTNTTTTTNNGVHPGQGGSSRDYFNLFTDLDDSNVVPLINMHNSSNAVLQEQDITPRHIHQQQQTQCVASQPGVSTSATSSPRMAPASMGRTMSPLTAVYTSVAHLNLAQHQHQHQHQYQHQHQHQEDASTPASSSTSPASATTSSYSVPSITLTPPQPSLHPILPEHHHRMIADVTLPVMQSPIDDEHHADVASLHQLCNGNGNSVDCTTVAHNVSIHGNGNGNAPNGIGISRDEDSTYQRDLDAYHMGVEHYNIGLGLDLGGVGGAEELDHLFPTTGDITDWALDFERASPPDAA
ncbi:hypothetical protein BD410DRAFT_852635 [Rickenella mellea]|uniref:HMG box domain-containing protein n=1 Tax=Rickenella mellea TaxID=50990 RepID=A0A4Y7PL73_9AGAM|nr:hypothetical protein BD410DRAFT_852635 [Rickenella mellea]